MNSNEDQLRYPIGKFAPLESYSEVELKSFIRSIADLPGFVGSLVKDFSALQWETQYREGSWTARQVVHHLADSHMNAYIRFKWTLTEETPVIKAYDEKKWAQTAEVSADPNISISLLTALHQKWAILLNGLTAEDLTRAFIHPDTNKKVSLPRMMALYSWHGQHHLGHLKIIAAKG